MPAPEAQSADESEKRSRILEAALEKFSPYGLKQDKPSVAQYRRRLETLALSVAAGMSGSRPA